MSMDQATDGVITEITHSPTLGALAKALAAAQSQMGHAKKSAQNPHLKNRYAQLEDVIDAVGPHLSASGIAYSQLPFSAGKDFVGVITLFAHESGEYLASKATMPVAKADAQGHGSGYTYLRRYALMGMAGIAPTDDDGEGATRPAVRKAPESGPKLTAGDVDPIVEGHVSAIDAATEVKSLLTIYASVTQDSRLPVAAKEYVTQLLSTKRRKLEGRAA